MKLLCMILAMVLLFFPIIVLAEDEEPTPTPTPTPTATPTPTPTPKPMVDEDPLPKRKPNLTIDTVNVYEGMNKSYEKGYTPTVNKSSVRIVLPLMDADYTLTGSAVTVTPKADLKSPFMLANRQFVVYKSYSPDYLVDFTIPLSPDRINGRYLLTLETKYLVNNEEYTQSFEVYVYITNGKDETPTSQPLIIVEKHSLNPETVLAGEEFTAVITLKNTSETKDVQNINITVSSDSPGLTLLNESNSLFFKSLKKKESMDIELKYKSGLDTAVGKHTVSLAMTYDNDEAQPLSSSGSIAIEISQPLRVKLEMPKIPNEVNAGDTLPLKFNVLNLSRSKVFNVRVELSAPGLLPSGSAFIGNMEGGTSGSANVNVFIGTKDMSEGFEGSEKYGYTSGTATLIYEDENGVEYTEETEVYTSINAPVISSTSKEVDLAPERASQWWISLIVAGAVAAGIAAFLLKKKKHRSYKYEKD